MTKVSLNGQTVDFDAVVNLMDDDVRERVHATGIKNEQDFVDCYCAAHRAAFGEEFVVN